MKIAIFANPIILENTGVGRIAYNLVKNILILDQKNEYLLIGNFYRNRDLNQKKLENFVKSTNNQRAKILITHIPDKIRDYLFGTNFPAKLLFRKKFDLYFALFAAHVPKNGFRKNFCVIYDFVFNKFAQTQGAKFSRYYYKRTKNAAQKSQKLLCISQSTQRDLMKLFGVAGTRAEIVYPAVNTQIFFPKKGKSLKTQAKFSITKPYILSVGTLEPRKNLERLIDAYLMLPEGLQSKYQLVLAGKSGWQNSQLLQKINALPKSKLIRTDYVSDEELAELYSNAQVFVYPSLYEGFGLPILEAMACGAPVISANNSSMPEVLGDAGLLVNSMSTQEISLAIEKILSNKDLQNSLSIKGLKQAQKFSWEKAAQETINLFNKAS